MEYRLKVGGKEYPLEMTVEAFLDISDLCPDGDFSRLNDVQDYPTRQRIEISAKMLAALSRGAENSHAVQDPAYKPDPLTASQLLALPLEEFLKIYNGMMTIMKQVSGSPTVETAQKKTKNEKVKTSG